MPGHWDELVKVFQGNPLGDSIGDASGGPVEFLGTAFLVSKTELLTCKHLFDAVPSWKQVYLLGGSLCGGGVVKLTQEPLDHPNADLDVALLRVNPEAGGGRSLQLNATPNNPPQGTKLTLAGFQESDQSVNTSNTKIASYDGVYHLIQTDTTINQGMSGGPAMLDGKVIGIVRAKNAAQALVIPVSLFVDWLSELIGYGNKTERDNDDDPSDRDVESVQVSGRRFAVAVSFPGEHREFVLAVVEKLAKELGREKVFYDRWYEAELVGSDLDLKLRSIYRDQSDMIVPFFSKHYEKPWCGVEWSAIRALMLEARREDRVKPVKLDDTVIPGWEQTDQAIELVDRSASDIAKLLIQIWALPFSTTADPAKPSTSGHSESHGQLDASVPDEQSKRFENARARLRYKVAEELENKLVRQAMLKANRLSESTSSEAFADQIFACKPSEYLNEETNHPQISTPLDFIDRCRKSLDRLSIPEELGTRTFLEKLWCLGTLIAPISFVAGDSQDLRAMAIGAAEQAEVFAKRQEVGVSQLAQFLGLVPNFNHQHAFDGEADCPLPDASDELEDHLHFGDGPNLLRIDDQDVAREVAQGIWTQVGAASDAVESVDAALRLLAASRSYVCLCLTQRLSKTAAEEVRKAFPTLYIIIPQSDEEDRINETVFLQLKRLKAKMDQTEK